MSYLQNHLLQNYKRAFPRETLKVTSKKTGVQLTRIFRLYNGSEMKISEFEAFYRLLNKESIKIKSFESGKSLTSRQISIFEMLTQRAVKKNSLLGMKEQTKEVSNVL